MTEVKHFFNSSVGSELKEIADEFAAKLQELCKRKGVRLDPKDPRVQTLQRQFDEKLSHVPKSREGNRYICTRVKVVPIVPVCLGKCRRVNKAKNDIVWETELPPILDSQFGPLKKTSTKVQLKNVRVVTCDGSELPPETLKTSLHPGAKLAISRAVTLKADAFIDGSHQEVILKGGMANVILPAVHGLISPDGSAELANGHSLQMDAVVEERDQNFVNDQFVLQSHLDLGQPSSSEEIHFD